MSVNKKMGTRKKNSTAVVFSEKCAGAEVFDSPLIAAVRHKK
ncbi:MAG: hypothetical protein Q7T18_11685 [Sedimentisphaerales bacterium]|nr:hypothetical protein [Sedimentisphaerales bacterium]